MTAVRRRRSRVRVAGLSDPDVGARVATDGGDAPMPLLPHERDERAHLPAPRTLPMRLAAEDLAAGRVDTDCRGSPTGRDCSAEVPALLKPRPTPATGQR